MFIVFISVGDSWCGKTDSPSGLLVLQGKVLDSAGNPLSDANVLPTSMENHLFRDFMGERDTKG